MGVDILDILLSKASTFKKLPWDIHICFQVGLQNRKPPICIYTMLSECMLNYFRSLFPPLNLGVVGDVGTCLPPPELRQCHPFDFSRVPCQGKERLHFWT